MAKKQTKADKEFIAKISTIGLSIGGSKSEDKSVCPDCGGDTEQVGMLVGEVHGQKIAGLVKLHRKPKGQDRADEQSFSA